MHIPSSPSEEHNHFRRCLHHPPVNPSLLRSSVGAKPPREIPNSNHHRASLWPPRATINAPPPCATMNAPPSSPLSFSFSHFRRESKLSPTSTANPKRVTPSSLALKNLGNLQYTFWVKYYYFGWRISNSIFGFDLQFLEYHMEIQHSMIIRLVYYFVVFCFCYT